MLTSRLPRHVDLHQRLCDPTHIPRPTFQPTTWCGTRQASAEHSGTIYLCRQGIYGHQRKVSEPIMAALRAATSLPSFDRSLFGHLKALPTSKVQLTACGARSARGTWPKRSWSGAFGRISPCGARHRRLSSIRWCNRSSFAFGRAGRAVTPSLRGQSIRPKHAKKIVRSTRSAGARADRWHAAAAGRICPSSRTRLHLDLLSEASLAQSGPAPEDLIAIACCGPR